MLITSECYLQTLTINNWNTMVSRYGQKKYLSESWKSANYLVRLHERRWVNKFCIAAHDMEGLDGHCFSNLHYNIFTAGISWAPTLSSGSSNAKTLFRLFPDDAIFISSWKFCIYHPIATLFLLLTSCAPKSAAPRQTPEKKVWPLVCYCPVNRSVAPFRNECASLVPRMLGYQRAKLGRTPRTFKVVVYISVVICFAWRW